MRRARLPPRQWSRSMRQRAVRHMPLLRPPITRAQRATSVDRSVKRRALASLPHKEERRQMEHIGAGLAAMGVIGPGIGIGILAGMAAGAIGRNPDAAGAIRGLAIILAAFAEGLGVLAIVVGLLAIFIS